MMQNFLLQSHLIDYRNLQEYYSSSGQGEPTGLQGRQSPPSPLPGFGRYVNPISLRGETDYAPTSYFAPLPPGFSDLLTALGFDNMRTNTWKYESFKYKKCIQSCKDKIKRGMFREFEKELRAEDATSSSSVLYCTNKWRLAIFFRNLWIIEVQRW